MLLLALLLVMITVMMMFGDGAADRSHHHIIFMMSTILEHRACVTAANPSYPPENFSATSLCDPTCPLLPTRR